MEENLPTGPSSTAPFESRTVLAAEEEQYTVLLLPDAANPEREAAGQTKWYFVLPDRPQLGNTVEGAPALSFTLLLRRLPLPSEPDITPLIERGLLNFELRLGVPDEILAALLTDNDRDSQYTRLFAREAQVTLETAPIDGVYQDDPSGGTGIVPPSQPQPHILASARVSGPDGRPVLNANLDRAGTLAALDALNGLTSGLLVRAVIPFRVEVGRQTVQLSGNWARIYDFLHQRVDDYGEISHTQVQEAVLDMLEEGVLLAESEAAGEPLELEAGTVFELFMRQSMIILSKLTNELDSAGQDPRYRLRSRPHESFWLNYSQTVSGAAQRTERLTTPLEIIIGGALESRDWDSFVHLVSAEGSGSSGVGQVPRRRQTRISAGSVVERTDNREIRLAALNGGFQSVSSAALPARKAGLSASAIFRPYNRPWEVGGPVRDAILVDDLVLELPQKDQPRSLPVVDNPAGALWPDRLNPKQYWYPPAFELIRPAGNAALENAEFLFSYERLGATESGQAALVGTVRFTLRKIANPKSEAAAKEFSQAIMLTPLPTDGLSVELILPFIDQRDGTLKTDAFPARLTESGDRITATVKLRSPWVELCYGSLSTEGFQKVPAKLRIAYAFQSYVKINRLKLSLAFGGKIIYTPIIYSQEEAVRLQGRSYLDAATSTYHTPTSEARFLTERETTRIQDRLPINRVEPNIELTRPIVLTSRPITKPDVTISPEVAVRPDVHESLNWVEYATRTQAQQLQLDALFPCNEFGRFYEERTGGVSVSIGCRDALKLGEINYKQYEELTSLATTSYRLYRSLVHPDEFLVVPAQYILTRYPAGDERAYRPNLILYAALDATNAVNNRINLDAVVQPNLEPYQVREIRANLAAYSLSPSLIYPTQLSGEATVTWGLDGDNDPEVRFREELIHISLETDLPGWNIFSTRLKTLGVHGDYVTKLPDGSQVRSEIIMVLQNIAGPWEGGPLEMEVSAGRIQLTNRIENTIDVSEIALYSGLNVLTHRPVETSLTKGGTTEISISADNAEPYPIYHLQPSSLPDIEEQRSLVERIFRRVAFLNQVDFQAHQLDRLTVEAKVKDLQGDYSIQLTAQMQSGEMEILLSLVTLISRPTLQYRVIKQYTDNRTIPTDWFELDLNQTGLVKLDCDLIGCDPPQEGESRFLEHAEKRMLERAAEKRPL